MFFHNIEFEFTPFCVFCNMLACPFFIISFYFQSICFKIGSHKTHVNVDGSSCISLGEFQKRLDDDRVIAYFHHLQLDVSEACTIFKLLDADRSGEVSIDEFLGGCWKLQGARVPSVIFIG